MSTAPQHGGRNFVSLNIFGTVFEVPEKYGDLQPVGMGAFGLVCSARDLTSAGGQTKVAIKKVLKPFSNSVLAKRTYRELKLLKCLQHRNVITLRDVFLSPTEDIYFVTDLMGTDLQRLLASRRLEKQYIQYFLYQILRALEYVHSAGVVHRDLKPSNVLINENCDLKICDFGLARMTESQMTGYVSTRYYRAPEIMLTWQRYDHEVDIWSAGCIFAEMLEGRPLFPGKDHVHQFQLITDLLGTPSEDILRKVSSENTLKFVRSLPRRERQPFSAVFTCKDPDALDLLEKMLVFDSQQRITAKQAIQHPYFDPYRNQVDEKIAVIPFDWSFTNTDLTSDMWRMMTSQEVLDFNNAPMTETAFASDSNHDSNK